MCCLCIVDLLYKQTMKPTFGFGCKGRLNIIFLGNYCYN